MAIGRIEAGDLRPTPGVSGGFAEQRTDEARERAELARAARIQRGRKDAPRQKPDPEG